MGNVVRIYEDVNHERYAIQDLQSGGGNGTGGGMETRVAKLESDVEHIKNDIAEIKVDIRDMRGMFVKVNDKIDNNFNHLNDKIDNNFKWLLATMGGFALLLLGAMAKGFGWI